MTTCTRTHKTNQSNKQQKKVAHLVTDDADDPVRLVLLMMLGALLTAWRGVPLVGVLLAPIVSLVCFEGGHVSWVVSCALRCW